MRDEGMKFKIAFTGNVFPFGEGFAYGGERVLYYLLQGLSELGHEIYLFSRKGTNVPSKFVKDYIPIDYVPGESNDPYYDAVVEYQEKHNILFDVYQCNYFGDRWNPFTISVCPVYVELTWCIWCHLPWNAKVHPFNTISYSRVMQQDFLNMGYETTMIHYGLPIDLYKYSPVHDGYAVWIGKIEGGKAPHLAIELAKAAGLKIVIMGPPYNTGCFWSQVAPYIDNKNVFWVRGVDDKVKYDIMSRAKVFISSNDNTWKEHFGIVNIEALACGTPILAFNRINQDCAIKVDNIITEGNEGFFLNYEDSNNVQEILDKGVPLLKGIGLISRADCRKQFERRFTNILMAKRYEWLYRYLFENSTVRSIEIPF